MPRGTENRWDRRLPFANRLSGRWPIAILLTLLVAGVTSFVAMAAGSQQAPVSNAAATGDVLVSTNIKSGSAKVSNSGLGSAKTSSFELSVALTPTKTASVAPRKTVAPSKTASAPKNTVAPSETKAPTSTATATTVPTDTPVPPSPTATATATPPPPPPWTRYNVAPGENLSVIGSRYGVAVDSLVVANGLAKPNLLTVGQTLFIPPAGWKPPWLDKAKQEEAQAKAAIAALPWLRYSVRAGDAMSIIAQNYKLDVATLAAANTITSPELIYSGQVLRIPPKGWTAGMPIPADKPLTAPVGFSSSRSSVASQGSYTVRAGDNLSGIALRYGVAMGTLATSNQIASTDLIYIGQTLTIPGRGASGGNFTSVAMTYTGGGDETVVAPPSMSPDSIDRVLAEYNSPAYGTGATFYSLGVQYGIDPAYALAFFIHESSGGTQGVAQFTRSIGNIIYTPGYNNYEGFRAYGSWEEGIADWYQLILTEYIQNMGRSTVADIVPVYAPAVENDVPGYINAVMSLVYSWRGSGGYFDSLGGAGLRANIVPQAALVTSEFGHYPDGSPHYGIDLAVPYGVEQTAPVGGIVVEVQTGCVVGDTTCGGGLGNHVWWRSAATGNFIVVGHLTEVNPALEVDAVIGAGAVLGITGATGWATGPHVHIQVNPNGPFNEGAIDPSGEFPWLVCGSSSPGLGELWGNASCQ